MRETYVKRAYRKTRETDSVTQILVQDIKRGRGRPKGSKNKPKTPTQTCLQDIPAVRKGRGRPKGSKNKPKTTALLQVLPDVFAERKSANIGKLNQLPLAAKKEAEVVEVSSTDSHPLMVAVKWIEKKMHPSQMHYYRTRSSRNSAPLQNSIAADILGFFNIQDDPILKLIKKNNLVVTISKNELP